MQLSNKAEASIQGKTHKLSCFLKTYNKQQQQPQQQKTQRVHEGNPATFLFAVSHADWICNSLNKALDVDKMSHILLFWEAWHTAF